MKFKIVKISRVIYLLLVVTFLFQVAISQSGYRVVSVNDGGKITGQVTIDSPPTEIPVLRIAKDTDHCGASVESPRLSVGKNGGVRYALVYLKNIFSGKPLDREIEYILDQYECLFDPYVLILPIETPLTVVNSDGILHNVRANRLGDNQLIFNIAQPVKGQRTTLRQSLFNKPGILATTCDAGHPWMSAYIVVVDHPYYAVTDENGKFTLDDVPPGTYEIGVWHSGVYITDKDVSRGEIVRYYYEEPYELSKKVTVKSGSDATVNFQLTLRQDLTSH